jgi:hypothetical protein
MKHFAGLLAVAVIFVALVPLLTPFAAHAGSTSTAVYTEQVTLGSGATQLYATSLGVYEVQVQNNAAHNMRCGDSNVTSTRGALLITGNGASDTWGPFPFQGLDLSQFYCIGTSGDVVDVIYLH